jgi:hypothetical protein
MSNCGKIYLEMQLNRLFDEAFLAFANYQECRYENHDEAHDAYMGSLKLYAKVAETSLEEALGEMQELHKYAKELEGR